SFPSSAGRRNSGALSPTFSIGHLVAQLNCRKLIIFALMPVFAKAKNLLAAQLNEHHPTKLGVPAGFRTGEFGLPFHHVPALPRTYWLPAEADVAVVSCGLLPVTPHGLVTQQGLAERARLIGDIFAEKYRRSPWRRAPPTGADRFP